MKRAELIVRILIAALLVTAVVIPLWTRSRLPLIHARMADNGGWAPGNLRAVAGVPLHLRLTSDDVTHGFALGQSDIQSVDIEPGKVTDVTLLFQKPGTYTFYCTRWCGINHWRMRGTIEVSGSEGPIAPATPPLYVKLGINLDAPHEAGAVPSYEPSAISPALSGFPLDSSSLQEIKAFPTSQYAGVDFYRSHSPYDTWRSLRAEARLERLDDQQVWNMVAFIWQSNTNPVDLARGKKLFAQNCAACHGESGGGNGVFAGKLAASSAGATPEMAAGQTIMVQRPADFTDARRVLGASPALLQGKILRGGMGTGMPSWGSIFTDEETWNLVAAIYSFQFHEQP